MDSRLRHPSQPVSFRKLPGVWNLAAAILIAAFCTVESVAQTNESQPKRESVPVRVMGYYAWWMGDVWKSTDLSLYDRLIFFTLRPDSSGRITETHGWPEAWEGLIDAAGDAGTAIVPTVAVMDGALIRSLFTDSLRSEVLLKEIMDLLRVPDVDGVHLDVELFEEGSAAIRDGYSSFVEALDVRMSVEFPEKDLSIFMPAFDQSGIFDEIRLAKAADVLVVQGYDLHWLTGPVAGPVATLRGWKGANWKSIVDRYLAHGVPLDKVVMAIPYFGYEWPTESDEVGSPTRGPGQKITLIPVDSMLLPLIQISALDRIRQYGGVRDSISGSPYYVFESEDGWYQGWFEDAVSLREKSVFLRESGLGGVAVFLIGYDGGRLDYVLRNSFR